MNEAYVCQDLNKMICFSKILWNARISDEEDSSLSKYGRNYAIYAKDRKNRKYYIDIGSSVESDNKFGYKLDDEKESFILAKVTHSMNSPNIEYFLFIKNKGFINIKFNDQKSFVATIIEMKIQYNIIKATDDDKEIFDYEKKDRQNDENKTVDKKEPKRNENGDIIINTKENGNFTESTIIRKIYKIRSQDNEEEEENEENIDFQQELIESRKKIKKMEDYVSFKVVYMGQAYVYEDLCVMKCFPCVAWEAKESDINNPTVIIKNTKQFYIKEFDGSYGIQAIDMDNKNYYFEIKSSCNSSSMNEMSVSQRKLGNQIDQKKESYIFVSVTNVLDSPVIEYFLFIKNNLVKIEFTNDKSFVQIVNEMKLKYI